MTMTSNAVATYEPLPWQMEPLMDKSPVLLLTGSAGGGKSHCAAEKVNAFMMHYPGARGLLVRKAREFASKSMVMSVKRAIGSSQLATYNKSELMFHYRNGSMIAAAGVKDEDQRESLRSIFEGGGVDIVWIEEANAISYEAYQEITTRMRGTAAGWRQMILTTNPGGPAHWIKKRLIDSGFAAVYYSSAHDNPHNPPDYIESLERLTGVQYERLVLGKWKSAEGALWSYDVIERQRCARPELSRLSRIVIGVDPAATATENSDETGVVVVAEHERNGHYYVLADATLRGTPAEWAGEVTRLYHRWQADSIIVEVNNGGDMVTHTLATADPTVPVKSVRASRGKHTRAEPIAALYEQGRVWHTDAFHDLEDQLTSWVVGDDSPDRLDALVWAVTELTNNSTPTITVGRFA